MEDERDEALRLKLEHEKWFKARNDLEQMIQDRKNEVQTLQSEFDSWETRLGNLKFSLERSRARKLGRLWVVITITLLLFMFLSFQKGNYLFVCLNGAGFLYNWRMVYVNHSEHAVLFSTGVLFLTFLFA